MYGGGFSDKLIRVFSGLKLSGSFGFKSITDLIFFHLDFFINSKQENTKVLKRKTLKLNKRYN
ncbi:hypothetical protein CLW00_11278 [Mongoliibacter ruber]|uniref:Uncharacterized protein n=1 Tax=Mongoliibacter ruber TaxID=1750599 RepID=A0A2T0WFK8_9BACT|nr:hypothetical protein CLW00_11278 [Mongoliibacter ruber]